LDPGVDLLRSRATGIDAHKPPCLDLTIAALWADRSKRPGFLVHDSTLFECVDERQRTLALDLLRRETTNRDYQHVLTLNTNELPRKLPDGFERKQYERLLLKGRPYRSVAFRNSLLIHQNAAAQPGNAI